MRSCAIMTCLLAVGPLAGCPAGPGDAAPALPVADLPPLAGVDEGLRGFLAEVHEQARAAPDDAGRRLALGMALHANEQHDAAAAAYRAALILDDDRARAWHLLGLLESDAGRLDEAASAFIAAAEREPTYAPARRRLGIVRLEEGRPDEAAEAFRSALEADPTDSAARLGLARAALARGDSAGAERALAAPDSAFGANAGYAEHLRRAAGRRREAAETDAAPVVSAAPAWRDPWTDELLSLRRGHGADARRAEALLRAGAFAEAERLLRDVHARRPGDVVAAVNLALARRESGDLDGSLAVLDDVLVKHPEHLPARFQLAVGLAHRATEPDSPLAEASRIAAENHLEHVLALNPGFAAAHGLRGDLHLMQHDPDAALARYEDATRIQPSDAGWSWRAGLCLVMADRYDEAIPWLERTLALHPDHVEARRALDYAMTARGEKR